MKNARKWPKKAKEKAVTHKQIAEKQLTKVKGRLEGLKEILIPHPTVPNTFITKYVKDE